MIRSTLCLAILAIVLSGCGDGTQRYTVSGKLTYKGQPVPSGFVQFQPDVSQGNRGPGVGAQVVEGHFVTEKGIVGGPHLVTIYGMDGVVKKTKGADDSTPQPKPLFPDYKTQFDFPQKNFEWNVDVPSS